MSQFAELFPFLASDRADVRKMASAGVAQLSKDNKELFAFLSDPANKDHVTRLVELIDPRLPASSIPTLGDVLLSIVNIAVDHSCCDALVDRKATTKLLKLYETLAGKSVEELPNVAALGELTLMALNNLTATSVSACEQLLELEDEDLAGYSFGRLKTHFDRDPEMIAVRKWILQIALNVCRVQEGTRLFLEDDDWCSLPVTLITSTNDHLYMRALGMQLLRNLVNFRESHAKLIDAIKIHAPLLNTVCVKENDSMLLHGWVDILAQLITSEDGMRGMDQVNAKRLLVACVKESSEQHRVSAEKEAAAAAAEGEEAAPVPARRIPLPWDIIKRINEELLPFLDDIQEMYVGGGNDDDDDDE